MPTPIHTLAQVDAGWATLFAGNTLASSGEAISVFIEAPATEEAPSRVFPSISVNLISAPLEDSARLEGRPEDEKMSEDTGASPRTSAMRDVPHPVTLLYSVDTWVKGRARDDRDMQQVIAEVCPPRVALTVGSETVWAFRTGGRNADEHAGDTPIYHKAYTYRVHVNLGSPATTNVEQAEEFQFVYKKGQHAEDADLEGSETLVDDVTWVVTSS